jgi:hypothetical protein
MVVNTSCGGKQVVRRRKYVHERISGPFSGRTGSRERPGWKGTAFPARTALD